MDPKRLTDIAEKAFSNPERTSAAETWKHLNEFINNNQYDPTSTSGGVTALTTWQAGISGGSAKGSIKATRVFDGTAGRAATTLASAIHGILTNPASPWVDIKFSGDTVHLNQDDESTKALASVVREIRTEILESKFSDAILATYMSYVTLGNAALLVEVDAEGYRFTPLHMAQIAWCENKDGNVDTVFRQVTMTAKQAFERFGKACPPYVLKELDKNPLTELEFCHVIMPRKKKDVKIDPVTGLAPAANRPIASYYLDMKDKKLLEEGGFYEMPILGVRYTTMPGEVYGRGPGHLAYLDVRSLNTIKGLILENMVLKVKPPIIATRRDLFGGQLNIKPGQVSVTNNRQGVDFMQIPGLDSGTMMEIEALINSIKESFFLDKLLLPDRTDTGEMTAYEVAQRIQQMNTVLGPVLSRLNHELLQPLVLRLFMHKLRNGRVPMSPAMKQAGASIQVVFNNQLSQAQRIQDVTTINQWAQTIGGLAQLNPTVVDNIDFDGVARYTAEVLGVPHEALKDLKAMQQEREARAQQMQQQQLMENAPGMADAANKLDQLGKGNQ